MPYAANDGVRIYYETEGSGPPLVLLCGLTRTLESWREAGYVDALRDAYDLILIDPRGHGQSDKPHDPAVYAYQTQVADITAVLDDAKIERAIFWGYSMGGLIGYGVMHYAPARFRAFIVGGMHPYAKDPEQLRQQAERFRAEGMAGFLARAEQAGGPLPPWRRAMVLANDPYALAATTIAMGESPDFADDVANCPVPVLIYAGERNLPLHDLAAQAATGHAQVTFVGLAGLDHGGAFEHRDVILPHVRAFLAGLGGTSAPNDR
jgi:pimeloyl-ACP methyl ester carboxylesterase